MREVLSTCPECGETFVAELADRTNVEGVELPCSPECNLAMVRWAQPLCMITAAPGEFLSHIKASIRVGGVTLIPIRPFYYSMEEEALQEIEQIPFAADTDGETRRQILHAIEQIPFSTDE